MASHARHSIQYVRKMQGKHGIVVVSPSRRLVVAGLLATTVIPSLTGSAYAMELPAYRSASAYTAGNGDAKAPVVSDSAVTRSNSTTGGAMAAASRSDARVVVNAAAWDGMKTADEIKLVKSAEQQDAAKALQDAVDAAQPTLDSSEGKADDADRKALQDAIDESKGMADDVSISAGSLNAQAAKVGDASKKVSDDVDAYNAREAAAASDAARAAADAAKRQNVASQPVRPQPAASAQPTTDGNAADSSMGRQVLEYAEQFNGHPYVWAAAGPDAFDCSGLVMYVYAHFGVSLPHYSGSQMNAGTAVPDINHAAYGDIIASPSHAALFAGFDSDGEPVVFNALNPTDGVTYTKLKYAFPNGYSIRRIFN